jgi:hypothetical protein
MEENTSQQRLLEEALLQAVSSELQNRPMPEGLQELLGKEYHIDYIYSNRSACFTRCWINTPFVQASGRNI